jgi:hypothetical protein
MFKREVAGEGLPSSRLPEFSVISRLPKAGDVFIISYRIIPLPASASTFLPPFCLPLDAAGVNIPQSPAADVTVIYF